MITLVFVRNLMRLYLATVAYCHEEQNKNLKINPLTADVLYMYMSWDIMCLLAAAVLTSHRQKS